MKKIMIIMSICSIIMMSCKDDAVNPVDSNGWENINKGNVRTCLTSDGPFSGGVVVSDKAQFLTFKTDSNCSDRNIMESFDFNKYDLIVFKVMLPDKLKAESNVYRNDTEKKVRFVMNIKIGIKSVATSKDTTVLQAVKVPKIPSGYTMEFYSTHSYVDDSDVK